MNYNFDLPKIPNRKPKTKQDYARDLATLIHSKKCRLSHIDQCSWYYENWDDPSRTRAVYLEKAYKMLDITNAETIRLIISIL